MLLNGLMINHNIEFLKEKEGKSFCLSSVVIKYANFKSKYKNYMFVF